MKILFLSETPHTQIGGIENHIKNLGEHLSSKMLHCHYLSAKELGKRSFLNKTIVSKKSLAANLLAINPEVVHVHGFSSFFVYQCLTTVKKTLPNVRLVYTPHYHPFEYHNHPFLAAMFFHFYLKRSLKYVDQLIALTEVEKDFFSAYITSDKIRTVPNGVNITSTVKEKTKPKEHSILFVGRDDHNKRLDFLLRQKEYFVQNNIRCHAVIDKMYPSDDTFIFYSQLSAEDLERLYDQCSVLVVPSKYEAFSIVALEAISHGMPVLISNHVQIKSYLKNTLTFNKVFVYDNDIDFIGKLEEILTMDPIQYEQLSRQNIKLAQAFTWELVVERLRQIYLAV